MDIHSQQVNQERPSQGKLIRQWMQLANEFFGMLASQATYSHQLPDNFAHKLRVMEAIAGAMADEAATLDVPYRFHCENCGKDFETFSAIDTVDGYVDACPGCGYGRWKVRDNLATEAPQGADASQ